jgi:hypothetical protein
MPIAGTKADFLWPTSPEEAKAYRDAEEKRLLPIMRAAGIKPE